MPPQTNNCKDSAITRMQKRKKEIPPQVLPAPRNNTWGSLHAPTHTHAQLCHHAAVQAWKWLSLPHHINQEFKAATYHNDSLFTYDKNQRGTEIPSILRRLSRPAQVTPPGSGPRTFSGNIHFLNRTGSPGHKANKNFLARPARVDGLLVTGHAGGGPWFPLAGYDARCY